MDHNIGESKFYRDLTPETIYVLKGCVGSPQKAVKTSKQLYLGLKAFEPPPQKKKKRKKRIDH